MFFFLSDFESFFTAVRIVRLFPDLLQLLQGRSLTLPSSLNNHTLTLREDLLQIAGLRAFPYYVQQHNTGNPRLLMDLSLFLSNGFSPWLFLNIGKP